MIRRLAAAVALLTLLLITAGGVVTNTDSGLACPDWPTCFGSPIPRMIGGVAVEHTHRLIGTAVGFLVSAIVVLALRRSKQGALAAVAAGSTVLVLAAAGVASHRFQNGGTVAPFLALVALGFAGCAAVLAAAREWDGKLSLALLMLVLVQGLLGGLTVVLRLPPTVLILHLGTSMLVLSAAAVLAWRTQERARTQAPRGLLIVTSAAVYLQILVGAAVRHTGAGLVCGVDLPFCRGVLWPSAVHPAVHLHMVHRAFAFVVLALVAATSLRIARASTGLVRALALAGPALVLLQIALGVLTILTFKGLVPLTAHLLVGASLLAVHVSLLALTRGEPAPSAARAPALRVAA